MLVVKNLPSIAGDTKDLDLTSGSWRSPREGYGNPLQTLAWRIPWTEKPGGLQSMESQRVGHDWSDLACTNIIKGGLIPHLPLNIVFHFILLCFLWSKRLTSNSFFFFFFHSQTKATTTFSVNFKSFCVSVMSWCVFLCSCDWSQAVKAEKTCSEFLRGSACPTRKLTHAEQQCMPYSFCLLRKAFIAGWRKGSDCQGVFILQGHWEVSSSESWELCSK